MEKVAPLAPRAADGGRGPQLEMCLYSPTQETEPMLACMSCACAHTHAHTDTRTHTPHPEWAHREGGRRTTRGIPATRLRLGWVHHECGLLSQLRQC